MDLSKNQLSELPYEIGRLTSLKELYLGGNGLRVLPSKFRNLRSLENLGPVSESTEQPVEIGNLKSLEFLYLSHNQLSELPPELDRLKNLKHLRVDGNPLRADGS